MPEKIKSQILNRKTSLTSVLYHDVSSNTHTYVEEKCHQSLCIHCYTEYYIKRKRHNGGLKVAKNARRL